MMTMVMVITSKQLISRMMKVVKLLMIAWGITELVKEMVTVLITAMVSLLMTVLVTVMTKEMITMTRSPRYHGRVNDCSKWPLSSSFPSTASCFGSS